MKELTEAQINAAAKKYALDNYYVLSSPPDDVEKVFKAAVRWTLDRQRDKNEKIILED